MGTKATEPVFTKEQILKANRFAKRKDLVNALLTDGKEYSIDQVERMIQKYLKGKVN